MITTIFILMQVKEEMVDPSELNMAPGWKVKFGKGRHAKRFLFITSLNVIIVINHHRADAGISTHPPVGKPFTPL